MDGYLSFGQWLKRRRGGLGLTQSALAKQVAYSPETIRKLESDQLRPSIQLAEKLADTLGISLDQRSDFVRYARDEMADNAFALPPHEGGGANVPPPHTPNNLPGTLTPFIGRAWELARLTEMLRDGEARLLTLTGAGGIGKSRLALEAATELLDHFTSGVYFVPLAQLTDEAQVVTAIARALRLEDRGARPLEERLARHLRGKRALLLLDNFEHVLGAAPLVGALLGGAPQLVVVATSREPLRLYGEVEFPIPPLALPDGHDAASPATLAGCDAIALFVQRTRASRPDFALTDANAAAVAEICRQCDGLPLAIELAAARTRLLTPQAMVARLSNRLEFLTGSARDLPSRQQTLHATIAWSYNLLEPGEQRLFRRLAILAGGGTLEAIGGICNAAGDLPFPTLDGIESLVLKSLLRHDEGSAGESRYTMLESIREFARERLDGSGEVDRIRDLHLDYFLGLAERAEPEIWSTRQVEWLRRLAAESDNFRAALDWALTPGREQRGLRLAGALWWFWVWHSPFGDGWVALSRLLERSADQPPTVARARALTTAANLAIRRRAAHHAWELAEEAIAVSRTLGDRRGLVHALIGRGEAAEARGDEAAATRDYEEALRLAREIDDRRASALVLNCLGNGALYRGESATAAALYEEALALFRELGNQWCVSFQLRGIALSALGQQAFEQARRTLEEALALDRAVGYAAGVSVDLILLGQLARVEGRHDDAGSLVAEGLLIAWEMGNSYLVAVCLSELGGLAALRGRHARAARLLAASEACLEAIDGRLDSDDQSFHDESVALLRARLDEAAFSAAWSAGRAMSPREAVADARASVAPRASPV